MVHRQVRLSLGPQLVVVLGFEHLSAQAAEALHRANAMPPGQTIPSSRTSVRGSSEAFRMFERIATFEGGDTERLQQLNEERMRVVR